MARSTLTMGSHEKRRLALTRALLGALHAAGLLLLPVFARRVASRAGHVAEDSRSDQLRGGRRMVRLLAVVSAVAAISTFGTGVAFGFLSNTTKSGTNNFAAGTLKFGTPTSTACSVSAIYPGQASTGYSTAGSLTPCSLKVTYAGSDGVYLALDVTIATKAGAVQSGAPSGTVAKPLYTGTKGLQLQIKDTANGIKYYVKGAKYRIQGGAATPTTVIPSIAAATCPTGFTTGYTCYKITDLLVSTSAFASGGTDTFSVNYALPSTSTSGYENGTATIFLRVHAVQSAHQTAPGSLPPACAGATRCANQTGLTWG